MEAVPQKCIIKRSNCNGGAPHKRKHAVECQKHVKCSKQASKHYQDIRGFRQEIMAHQLIESL